MIGDDVGDEGGMSIGLGGAGRVVGGTTENEQSDILAIPKPRTSPVTISILVVPEVV